MSESNPLPPIGQLRWQCRRGMLELDYVLVEFLEEHYESLSDALKRVFIKMLDSEDQLLMDWAMANVVPSDPAIRQIIDLMRSKVK